MKVTYVEINGKGQEIFKDPKTDNGTKKSAKGLLRVDREDGKYVLYDQQSSEMEKCGCLETVFFNGHRYTTSFEAVKALLNYFISFKTK